MTNFIGIGIIAIVFLVILWYFIKHKKTVNNTLDETTPEIGDEWKQTEIDALPVQEPEPVTVQEKKVLIDSKLEEIKKEELKKVSVTKKTPKKSKGEIKVSTSKSETKKAKPTTKKVDK